MQQIPLQQVPNQSFSIILDLNTWDFLFKETNGIIAASLSLNGVDVIDSNRCVSGSFIIPARYQEAGNFFFATQNYQLPAWRQFGITQALIYISAAELDVLRIKNSPPITAADFNPIAALPLRFAPVGYTEAP